MKVLLLQDVDNLGLAGSVVKVADGYGRNYLLPQQLAILATPSALKQAEAISKAGELRRAQEKEDALAIANQLKDAMVIFERRAGERGKLYGSVTAGDIADAIQEKYGIEVHKRKIALPEPIRNLGDFDVILKLMVEVSTTIKVAVVGEGKTDDYLAGKIKIEPVAEEVAEVVEVVEVVEEAAAE